MQEFPLQGSIDAVFFPRLVGSLHVQAFEGILRVSLGATLKVIYFRRGEIASAASNDEADRLHNILIHDGRLTQPQLDMARSRVVPERSLVKALIEMGFLTPAELVQGARRQVGRILASCFDLRDGTYQMEPGPLPPEVTVLGLPTKRLIFDSLMEISARESIVREIASMESVYRPLGDLSLRLGALKLEPVMEQVARMFDGRATLRELSGRTSLDDFAVGKLALALDILGLAERIGGPAQGVSLKPASFSIPIESEAQEGGAGRSHVAVVATEPPASTESLLEARMDEPAGIPPPEISSPEPMVTERPRPPAWHEETPAEPMRSVEAPTESTLSGPPDTAPVPAETAPPEPPMPPIPDEELPAFARASDADESWAVDPETGERVHVGPIEVTFDGTVGGPRTRSGTPGRLLAYAVVAVVALAAASWYVLRRVPREDRSVVVERSVVPEAHPAASPGEPAPPKPEPAGAAPVKAPTAQPTPAQPTSARATPAEPPPVRSEPATPSREERPQAGPAPVEPSVPRGHSVPPPRPKPVATAAPAPPIVAPRISAPPPTERAPSQSFADAAAYAAARARFEGRDYPEAATRFQELVAAAPADQATLQLMIACEAETIETALSRSGRNPSLFILPFSLRGRPCYRVCWGVYADREKALEAVSSLPASLAAEGTLPYITTMGRLHPPRSVP